MKKLLIFLALALFIVIPFTASQAFEVKVDNSVKLNKEEIAGGNVYASCGDMVIDGVVNGDVIAVCKNITINGIIDGDLIAFSNNIVINGEVKGSARIAGVNLDINGTIGHNINAFGTKINLSPSSIVNWDVLVAGVNGFFNGNIGGNLHGYISTATVAGKIGKNIDLKIEEENTKPGQGGLLITKDAVIGGNLAYSALQDAKIESPSSVAGSVIKQEPKNNEDSPLSNLFKLFFKLSALILIGLVLISLSKKLTYRVTGNLETKFWPSLLIGLAVLIATPLLILFFTFTLIGIPLALILLAIYFTTVSLSIIFSSFYFGDFLLKKLFNKSANAFVVLIFGLFIFILLASLPYIGWFFSLLAIVCGLGAAFLTIKNNQNDESKHF